MAEAKEIKPQAGYQEKFFESPADIVIGGGAAGAGKTWALLYEFLRNKDNENFGAVIFRRTYPQITGEGGLWDTSQDLYRLVGGKAKENNLEWEFDSGAKLKFSHLQHEKNIYDYQGSQICYLGFDELTHFTQKMFFYLMSRNRSMCGVTPFIRATCNPDPDSWVARFIEWWIDPNTGFPITERDGAVRYFTQDNDSFVWGNSKKEVLDKIPHILEELPEDIENPEDLIKSVTFIAGTIYGNKELLKKNPQYLGTLLAMSEAEKMQLLKGNWKVKISKESMIQYNSILDSFTNEYVKDGTRYITTDIALHGSDQFILFVWSGWRIIDIEVMDKGNGKEIEEKIKSVARKYSVQQSHIVYDADGLGSYLKGYLATAYSFNNGGKPIEEKGKKVNYANLKTQCYYLLAEKINEGEIYITPKVAESKIKNKFVKDIITDQTRAIKKGKDNSDKKLTIISKPEMKNIIGCSPDYLDAMMMRIIFQLKQVSFKAPKLKF